MDLSRRDDARGLFRLTDLRMLKVMMDPYIADNVLKLGVFGKATLPSVLGVNHWIVIVPLAMVVAVALRWMDRWWA